MHKRLFVKINKMCKNHKLLFGTELIFCNYPKASGKIKLGLFGLAYKNTSLLQHSLYDNLSQPEIYGFR